MSQRRLAQPHKLALAVCIILASVAWRAAAQATGSDYAKLRQLTSQLQNSPANAGLRKQIIALALKLPAPPAETAAALKAEGAGEYAFKHAQTQSDFSSAAEAFEQAALIEPWVAANYYNAGQAYAKAKHFNLAIAALNWYLTAAPNAGDRDAVLKRIGALEYARVHPAVANDQPRGQPVAQAQAAAAARQRRQDSLAGHWNVRFNKGAYYNIGGSLGNWTVCAHPYGFAAVAAEPCEATTTTYSGKDHLSFIYGQVNSSHVVIQCSRIRTDELRCQAQSYAMNGSPGWNATLTLVRNSN